MSDFFIYLDSRDAIDTDPSNCDFQLNLNFNAYQNPFISLEELAFQNLVYPINSNYNTLVVDENATSTLTVSLTEKNYTGNTFATEIQTQLNTNTLEGIVYTVSYDDETRKLTISADGANTFQILSDSTCLRELGLLEAMPTAQNSYTMLYPVRLDGSEYVDIETNLPLNNISSNGRTNILARVYLTSPFGSLQTFENNTPDRLRLNTQQFSSINIKLLDDRNNFFTIPKNSNSSYVFKLSV